MKREQGEENLVFFASVYKEFYVGIGFKIQDKILVSCLY